MLGGGALVVTVFLGLAGISLDQAHRDSTTEAMHAQMQAHVYLLLATAEEDELGRPRLPQTLSAPGFNRPDSGLYGKVAGLADRYQWQSTSLLGRDFPLQADLHPGQIRINRHGSLLVMQQGIGWDDLDGNNLPYVFAVALEAAPLDAQHAAFRTTLWVWLGALGILLLAVQVVLVRWGLRPLRTIAGQVRNIEQGQAEQISGPVPRELAPLTENLNSLMHQTEGRQQRLRHSLADLSHSLKTPLAVLRGAARGNADSELARQVDEQTARIDQIVSYQRQRLSVAGSTPLLPALPVTPILQRLCDGLLKIHGDRELSCRIDVAEGFAWRADQGDLFELFGNLLENACKYGKSQVLVRTDGKLLVIEDDGPGIDPRHVERLLQRGQRGDQQQPGDGIGLAVVQEIVTQYGGRLAIKRSSLGGTCVQLMLD
jgi:two-component system sensor histidine kinase PhoQ